MTRKSHLVLTFFPTLKHFMNTSVLDQGTENMLHFSFIRNPFIRDLIGVHTIAQVGMCKPVFVATLAQATAACMSLWTLVNKPIN